MEIRSVSISSMNLCCISPESGFEKIGLAHLIQPVPPILYGHLVV